MRRHAQDAKRAVLACALAIVTRVATKCSTNLDSTQLFARTSEEPGCQLIPVHVVLGRRYCFDSLLSSRYFLLPAQAKLRLALNKIVQWPKQSSTTHSSNALQYVALEGVAPQSQGRSQATPVKYSSLRSRFFQFFARAAASSQRRRVVCAQVSVSFRYKKNIHS